MSKSRASIAVNDTISDAHSSTKNRDGRRGPEMHKAKQINRISVGRKGCISVDIQTKLTHRLMLRWRTFTTADCSSISAGSPTIGWVPTIGFLFEIFAVSHYSLLFRRQCGASFASRWRLIAFELRCYLPGLLHLPKLFQRGVQHMPLKGVLKLQKLTWQRVIWSRLMRPLSSWRCSSLSPICRPSRCVEACERYFAQGSYMLFLY